LLYGANFLRCMQLPYSYQQKSDFGRSVALGADVAPGSLLRLAYRRFSFL
jgi:hypothetical protein